MIIAFLYGHYDYILTELVKYVNHPCGKHQTKPLWTESPEWFSEKTVDQNWPLLFHRDINLPDYMNIPKDQREDFLKKCIMCRLNLDTSDETTGALKVIPGSHIDKNEEERFINTDEGEVIFFKPLLLHGSNKMTKPHTRRVFQALCIEKN